MSQIKSVKVIFIPSVVDTLHANGFLHEETNEVIFTDIKYSEYSELGLHVTFNDKPNITYFYPAHQIARLKVETF